jgi:hypothetical protein
LKRLIVNADDFGRTSGVNAGVLEAHLYGIVTSATVMVLEPAAEEGVAQARRRAPRLSLGLHFALTGGGRPASDPNRVPSLVVDGRFPRASEGLRREIPAAEIARELEAQMSLFEKMAGSPPSHMDSHHHAALHPPVQAVFAETALSRGLPVRAASVAAREELRAAGLRTPDLFLDGFYGEGANVENLRALIRALPHGAAELMCHPAHVDEPLLTGSSYAKERERELALLCDPDVRMLLEQEDVELIAFPDL